MEMEPIPQEELEEEKLPEVVALHAFKKQDYVECPYCGSMEHAPDTGEPGCVKECEYQQKMGIKHPKKYIVKKAA